MEEKVKQIKVIDASFMLGYLLPDERQGKIQKEIDKYKSGSLQLISVSLFPYEVINGIYAAVLSKRLSLSLARDLISDFLTLPINYEQIEFITAFDFASTHKISVYDASYLLLARSKQIPLLTLDRKLSNL